MSAPLPPNERERLETLDRYQILDTLPDRQFDDLTLLAAQICQAPISLISLVDRERQWFKSRHGLEAAQTSREVSFCAHAILHDGVFEVPDAAVDARFADNSLVTGAPHIRHYAGAPLMTPDGFALGTLCVLDRAPRQLSPAQLTALEALARQVVSQLELRRAIERLESADAARGQAFSHLAANAALLCQFVEHVPAAVAMLDRDLRYLAVSRRFVTDYGLGERNVSGLSHYEVFPHLPERWKAMHRRVLAGAVERCERDEWVQSDGTLDFLQWEVRPWHNARGEIGGLIMLTEIVSERVRAEHLKDEFISVVSHELRTPLTSIRGALGLLNSGAAGELPQGARQMIDIAQKNGDRLMLLINDLLDIEKIESGQMRFDLKPVSVKNLLASALELNREYAAALGVELCLETAPLIRVWGDEERLQQVLSNLLSNACKFTAAGGAVHLGAEMNGATARIWVRDEGEGVAREFVPHLFEKFAQADSSSTRKQGGTGLGLPISRAIVEKHGGILDYLPTPDRNGATFFFDLPLASSEDAP